MKILLSASAVALALGTFGTAHAGPFNDALIDILGGNLNHADILQNGLANRASIGVGTGGDSNTADIVQVGSRNMASGISSESFFVEFPTLSDNFGSAPPSLVVGAEQEFTPGYGIEQDGDFNAAGIFQRSPGINFGWIEQSQNSTDATHAQGSGDGFETEANRALLVQDGAENWGAILQVGYGNLSDVQVYGFRNETFNRQEFDLNTNTMTVNGIHNRLLSWQNAGTNVSLPGNTNTMTVNGNGNFVTSFQDSQLQTATHDITGNRNESHIAQY